MGKVPYSVVKAKQLEYNKRKWLRLYPKFTDEAGIYILTRTDAEGFKYAYVGQSIHCLTRLAQHLMGYQHIDLSLKKHGFYDEEDNPDGWRAKVLRCRENELDECERFYIKLYADQGYQMRNKTIGGQNAGKSGLSDNKPAKGYYDGKKQGWRDCQKYVAEMFTKYLHFSTFEPTNKIRERKYEEFKIFISGEQNEDK